MPSIASVVLDAADPGATDALAAAVGVGDRVAARGSDGPAASSGAFSLSLVVARPSTVDRLVEIAADHGATIVKPAEKSLWGYGGVVRSPDGAIWKVASSSKKDQGAPTTQVDDLVLLLGADDVKASKRFYVDRGMGVGKSFGGRYAQFDSSPTGVTLALAPRRTIAKDTGVTGDAAGRHGLAIRGDLGAVTDPDGFAWEPAS